MVDPIRQKVSLLVSLASTYFRQGRLTFLHSGTDLLSDSPEIHNHVGLYKVSGLFPHLQGHLEASTAEEAAVSARLVRWEDIVRNPAFGVQPTVQSLFERFSFPYHSRILTDTLAERCKYLR